MRKLAAVGLCVTILSGTAAADDLGQLPPGVYSYPPIVRLYTWNGPYIGGHAGFGWNNTFESETNGFVGGVQAGFNLRAGHALAGLELQWMGSGNGGNDSGQIVTFADGLSGTFDSELDWATTLTARFGLVWDRSLFYVRGGPAWARNGYHASVAGVSFDSSETRSGWAAGLGFEFAFRNAWSARLEYMFMDFGSDTVSLNGPAGGLSVADVDQQIHAVTLGVNYRFDWPTTGLLGPN